jgi:hypothetical protein
MVVKKFLPEALIKLSVFSTLLIRKLFIHLLVMVKKLTQLHGHQQDKNVQVDHKTDK